MTKVLLCPSCKSPVPQGEGLKAEGFPFCSDRCRMVDLGRWFGGDYKMPQPIAPDDYEAIAEVLSHQQPKA